MTCRHNDCEAVPFADGRCFEHLDPDRREQELSAVATREVAERDLDLQGVTFDESALRALTDALKSIREIGRLDISGAIISDDFDLSGVRITSFGAQRTNFRGLVRLRDCEFGSASFFAATFDELVRLGGVRFRSNSDFREATFAKRLSRSDFREGSICRRR